MGTEMRADSGDALGEARPPKVSGDSRPCLGGPCSGANPRTTTAKVEQLSRREQLEAWKATRPPTQKRVATKSAGYNADWASVSVGSRTSARSALSDAGSLSNCRPKAAMERAKLTEATATKSTKAGPAKAVEGVPRTPKQGHASPLVTPPVTPSESLSQRNTTGANARTAKSAASVIAKAGPAGATPPAATSRSSATVSGLNFDKLDSLSNKEGMEVEHSILNAPPPSPCTPYARRLPAPCLDRIVLAEVLRETFKEVATAWNVPNAHEIFIGYSPCGDWEAPLSPVMSNKENVRPVGSSGRTKLRCGTLEFEEAETEVGDERSEEPSPFYCSSVSPALRSSNGTPPMPEDLLTRGWIAQSRNKRPSLSDWYADIPDA